MTTGNEWERTTGSPVSQHTTSANFTCIDNARLATLDVTDTNLVSLNRAVLTSFDATVLSLAQSTRRHFRQRRRTQQQPATTTDQRMFAVLTSEWTDNRGSGGFLSLLVPPLVSGPIDTWLPPTGRALLPLLSIASDPGRASTARRTTDGCSSARRRPSTRS